MELHATSVKKAKRWRHVLTGGVSYFVGGETFAFEVGGDYGHVHNGSSFCTSPEVLAVPAR